VECKDCPAQQQGWSGSADMGAGYISDKSAKFGEYNGLYREGGYFIGDGTARFRGPDGYYWNINAADLGLDTRSLDAEGGRQGKYKLLFKYEQLSHHISDTVNTPFLGTGSASLTCRRAIPRPRPARCPWRRHCSGWTSTRIASAPPWRVVDCVEQLGVFAQLQP